MSEYTINSPTLSEGDDYHECEIDVDDWQSRIIVHGEGEEDAQQFAKKVVMALMEWERINDE